MKPEQNSSYGDRQPSRSLTKYQLSVAVVILGLLLSGSIPPPSIPPSTQVKCPEPFPSSYQPPAAFKDVQIKQLGIIISVPQDRRLVYIKKEKNHTFMTPPQYESYQCSLRNGVDYTAFYPYMFYYGYTSLANPKRLPLKTFVRNVAKEVPASSLNGVTLNGINFITTPANQADFATAWFIPRNRNDIVVQYSSFCDCVRSYGSVINDLSNIKNLSD
jgi:hypothetical protein